MIVPIVLAAGAAYGVWRHKKHAKGMTPIRKATFEALLKDPKVTADKLTTMAKEFEAAGLKAEGAELKKRASILTAPPATLEARKAAFKKAMNSTDQAAVKKMAEVFHKVGHYEAATKLRNYAKGLFHHGNTSATIKV
jgi:hypothetical protein